MNHVLLKYCLTMLIEKKRKREDGMPKKHDPKKRKEREREREREDGMPKKHDPAIKSDMKRSMYLSVH